MRFVESDAHGNQFFAFEHSPRYQAVQKLFFQAVESMFPENIVVSVFVISSYVVPFPVIRLLLALIE